MARTKNRARAGHSGSKQRSTTVNDGGGNSVGTTTVETEGNVEVGSASSSERTLREAKQEETTRMHAEAEAETSGDMRNRTEAATRDAGITMVSETARNMISGGEEGHATQLSGQGAEATVETAMMGAASQQAKSRRITNQRNRVAEGITGVRSGSNEGMQRTQEVAASFYTARETAQEGTTATTARRARAVSESPSVASPLKMGQHRPHGQLRRDRSRGTMRRLEAPSGGISTAITESGNGATQTGEGVGGNTTTSTNDEANTDGGSGITGNRGQGKRKAKRTRSRMGYKQQVRPMFERLLGQLELALLGGMEEVVSKSTESEWSTVDCPALVRLFMNKQTEFARFIMAASSKAEAVGELINMQATWDRRKTKQDTEERSL